MQCKLLGSFQYSFHISSRFTLKCTIINNQYFTYNVISIAAVVAQQVLNVNVLKCRFDSHSGIHYIYFHFQRQRRVLSFDTQCLKNWALWGEQSVLELGSLYLSCYARNINILLLYLIFLSYNINYITIYKIKLKQLHTVLYKCTSIFNIWLLLLL